MVVPYDNIYIYMYVKIFHSGLITNCPNTAPLLLENLPTRTNTHIHAYAYAHTHTRTHAHAYARAPTGVGNNVFELRSSSAWAGSFCFCSGISYLCEVFRTLPSPSALQWPVCLFRCCRPFGHTDCNATVFFFYYRNDRGCVLKK